MQTLPIIIFSIRFLKFKNRLCINVSTKNKIKGFNFCRSKMKFKEINSDELNWIDLRNRYR